jgi:hypothetical protein
MYKEIGNRKNGSKRCESEIDKKKYDIKTSSMHRLQADELTNPPPFRLNEPQPLLE